MKAMNPLRDTRRKRAAATVILLVTLSGCSGKTGGTPIPTTSNRSSVAPTGSSSAPTNVFGALNACVVLDKALEGQKFSPAVLNKAGGDNGCGAEKGHDASAGLTLQPNAGIQDLNADPSKIRDGHINGRPSAQIRNSIRAEGDCAIAIEVTKTSRALVVITLSTGTTDEACKFVESVANKVEPQLPKGN